MNAVFPASVSNESRRLALCLLCALAAHGALAGMIVTFGGPATGRDLVITGVEVIEPAVYEAPADAGAPAAVPGFWQRLAAAVPGDILGRSASRHDAGMSRPGADETDSIREAAGPRPAARAGFPADDAGPAIDLEREPDTGAAKQSRQPPAARIGISADAPDESEMLADAPAAPRGGLAGRRRERSRILMALGGGDGGGEPVLADIPAAGPAGPSRPGQGRATAGSAGRNNGFPAVAGRDSTGGISLDEGPRDLAAGSSVARSRGRAGFPQGFGGPASADEGGSGGLAPRESRRSPALLAGPIANRPVISRSLPAVPAWARAQGAEGTVVLRFSVDSAGHVRPVITVERTSGYSALDALAIEHLRRWSFEPRPGSDEWGTLTLTYRLS